MFDLSFFGTVWYNPFLVYCRELAPSTVSLTGDRAQGDNSKHDSHYSTAWFRMYIALKCNHFSESLMLRPIKIITVI